MCTLREDEASRLYCYRDPSREGCVWPSSDRETFAIRRAPDLGALLTLGVGNYAPSLVTFSLLGIDPRAAFPIMMGTRAFVATIAGVRFITSGRFHGRAALGLTVGGIAGVIIAAWLVQSLPLEESVEYLRVLRNFLERSERPSAV